MVELIPPKDVRAYAKEVGWELSDMDKASLASHAGSCSFVMSSSPCVSPVM